MVICDYGRKLKTVTLNKQYGSSLERRLKWLLASGSGTKCPFPLPPRGKLIYEFQKRFVTGFSLRFGRKHSTLCEKRPELVFPKSISVSSQNQTEKSFNISQERKLVCVRFTRTHFRSPFFFLLSRLRESELDFDLW